MRQRTESHPSRVRDRDRPPCWRPERPMPPGCRDLQRGFRAIGLVDVDQDADARDHCDRTGNEPSGSDHERFRRKQQSNHDSCDRTDEGSPLHRPGFFPGSSGRFSRSPRSVALRILHFRRGMPDALGTASTWSRFERRPLPRSSVRPYRHVRNLRLDLAARRDRVRPDPPTDDRGRTRSRRRRTCSRRRPARRLRAPDRRGRRARDWDEQQHDDLGKPRSGSSMSRASADPANASPSWAPEPSTIVGVALHKELYDFGRIEAQADALDALAQSADAIAKVAELDLGLLVEESFYAVLGARQVLAASEAAVTRARAHRELAQAKVSAQLWPPLSSPAPTRTSLGSKSTTSVPPVRSRPRRPCSRRQSDRRPGSRRRRRRCRVRRGPAFGRDRRARRRREQLAPSKPSRVRSAASSVPISACLPRSPRAPAARRSPRTRRRSATAGPRRTELGHARRVQLADLRPHRDGAGRTSQRLEPCGRPRSTTCPRGSRTLVQRSSVDLDVARAALPALQRSVDAATANHAQTEARFTGGLATGVELSDAEVLLTDAQYPARDRPVQPVARPARLARVLVESTP